MIVRRVLGLALVALVTAVPSTLPAATTYDYPGGPLTLGNAPEIGAIGGDPVSLRINRNGDVVFRRGDAEQRIADRATAGGQVSSPVLHVDGAGVHAFWRVKLAAPVANVGVGGDKLIYVRSSTDGGKSFGPPVRLNQMGGAFDPLTAGDGKGTVYAVWVDERYGKYHVYVNRTNDNGKTWQARDTQLDIREQRLGGTFDASLLASGDQAWVVWIEGSIGRVSRRADDFEVIPVHDPDPGPLEPFVIMLRRTTDGGKTWLPPVRLVEPGSQPFSVTFLRWKASLFLYWHTHEGGFAGLKSTDDGRTWTSIRPLKDVAGQVGAIGGAVDPVSGRVILAYGIDREGERTALWVSSSADGAQFDPPVLLPTKIPHLTSAVLPKIVPGKDGVMLALWQDGRYFRPTPCARLSKDGGRTWLERDTCLEEPPGKFITFFPKAVSDGDRGFFAEWVRYTDDLLENAEMVLTRVDPARLPTPPGPDQATRARLEERVEAYWKTRVAGDWAGSFGFMDHIFRSRVRREGYVGSQGVVKYHDFKIEKIEITERVAKAIVRYTYEIERVDLVPGKKVAVPKREDPTTQEWIFVDGDWYLVFKDIMNQPFVQF